MLKHKFFNQTKKLRLTDFLTDKRPLRPLAETIARDQGILPPIDSKENILEHLRSNLCVQMCLNCAHCKYSGYVDQSYLPPVFPKETESINWNF